VIPPCLQVVSEAELRLRVKAQPRAARTALAGLHGPELKVRVAAPPVDDAANAELQRFLAETLGLPRAAVRLVQGRTAGHKVFALTGLSAAEAARRLGLAA
jgi:uncharacterized protein (TIGR00251 family)